MGKTTTQTTYQRMQQI